MIFRRLSYQLRHTWEINAISPFTKPIKCSGVPSKGSFEIIGEAMSRIEKVNPAIAIESKKLIISMRNRVIHVYIKLTMKLSEERLSGICQG